MKLGCRGFGSKSSSDSKPCSLLDGDGDGDTGDAVTVMMTMS